MQKIGKRYISSEIAIVLLILLGLISLSACADLQERQISESRFNAYGKTWKFYTVERYTKTWGFGSTHGIFGMIEDLEQFVYLETQDGKKISVHDRLYALQSDGSYKKIDCCHTARTQAEIYNFDNKLVIYFNQVREKTTDCFVYPEGHPDDEKVKDPGKRFRYVQLFGEFDPDEQRFYISNFLPEFSPREYEERLGKDPEKKERIGFFYSKRKPFVCSRT